MRGYDGRDPRALLPFRRKGDLTAFCGPGAGAHTHFHVRSTAADARVEHDTIVHPPAAQLVSCCHEVFAAPLVQLHHAAGGESGCRQEREYAHEGHCADPRHERAGVHVRPDEMRGEPGRGSATSRIHGHVVGRRGAAGHSELPELHRQAEHRHHDSDLGHHAPGTHRASVGRPHPCSRPHDTERSEQQEVADEDVQRGRELKEDLRIQANAGGRPCQPQDEQVEPRQDPVRPAMEQAHRRLQVGASSVTKSR
jgi:hypothetical protein